MENPKHDQGGQNFIGIRYDNVTHLADGESSIEATCITSPDVGTEDLREALVSAHGTSPEHVELPTFDREDRAKASRRGRVAFSSSRWNSSWIPGSNPTNN